jgi:GNAT superfamily N-acetyltransferase
MQVIIREAQILDSESIAQLSIELGYEQNSVIETENRLNYLLQSKNDKVYVAIQDSIILGWIHAFISYRLESDPFTEIGGLVVSSNCRGQGIGKLLVSKINSWSEKLEYNIRVRCNSKRTSSHKFYEKIAFNNIKTQHVFEKNK